MTQKNAPACVLSGFEVSGLQAFEPDPRDGYRPLRGKSGFVFL